MDSYQAAITHTNLTRLDKSSSATVCGFDSLSESSFATAVCNIRLFMKVAIRY